MHRAWSCFGSQMGRLRRRVGGVRVYARPHSTRAAPARPVVIVGAGTVGKCLSLLLHRQGVSSVLLERSRGEGRRAQHPRAHVLHTRGMEIMREMGLEDAIHERAPPLDEWRHFRYLETMLGREFGSVDFFAGPSARRLSAASPARFSHLSQPRLDELLDAEIETAGNVSGGARGMPPSIILKQSAEFIGLDDKRDGKGPLRVNVRNVSDDGALSETVLECEYLVGCDGPNSRVRREIGIGLTGESALQHFISIHFTCPSLHSRLSALDRHGMLHFVFNGDVIGVLVAHNSEAGEWVAQIPFYPEHQTAEAATANAACEQALRACIGEDVSVRVHSADAWCMNGLVADAFCSGDARVFLAGDSAHQFPPSGGFGLNAGIMDAHNLAWKLASAVRSSAGSNDSLLRSYCSERREAAAALRDLSVDNFRRGLLVPRALGLEPNVPDLVSQALSSDPAKLFLPRDARDRLFEGALSLGRGANTALRGAMQTAGGQAGESRLRRLLSRHRALPLLFPRHDLGLEYSQPGRAAVAGPETAAAESSMGRVVEGVEQYEPRLAPGARMPHVWLLSQQCAEAADVSSVDIVSGVAKDGPRESPGWTLFCDGQEGDTGVDSKLADRDIARVHIVASSDCIKERQSPSGVWSAVDTSGAWARLVAAAACSGRDDMEQFTVLVRPDGYIYWCGAGGVDAALKAYDQLVRGA